MVRKNMRAASCRAPTPMGGSARGCGARVLKENRIIVCEVQRFYVGFDVGGFELGLVPDGTPGTAGPQPLWGVASATAALARLVELGADVLDAVQEVGEGIRVAAVRDPFGNRLGIIENPHFKQT